MIGTEFTMQGKFYKERMSQHGLELMVPEEEDFKRVNAIIFEELCKGVVSDASRDLFSAVIKRLKKRGAEAIIFGCTEIGLLVPEGRSSLPVFDSMKTHVDAAIAAAFENTAMQKAS